jgi:hypothetical protein
MQKHEVSHSLFFEVPGFGPTSITPMLGKPFGFKKRAGLGNQAASRGVVIVLFIVI